MIKYCINDINIFDMIRKKTQLLQNPITETVIGIICIPQSEETISK